MKKPKDLNRASLVSILSAIQKILWQDNRPGGTFWNPEKEWQAETLDAVGEAMSPLRPVEEESCSTVEDPLEVPEGLSWLGLRAHTAVVSWLRKKGLTDTGGCKVFYSPTEWKKSSETHGLNSELIVVHDGGAHAPAFDGKYEQPELSAELQGVLGTVGCWAAQHTSWCSAIYSFEAQVAWSSEKKEKGQKEGK